MTTHPLAVGNITIHQHGGLYSLKDLHRASGSDSKHQPAYFVRREETKVLIAETSKSANSQIYSPIESRRGNRGGTYACRELVIAYAAWISAEFHLRVIRVFLDTAAPEQPAQQALPMNDVHTASGLDASIVNEIVSTTTHNIVETLKRRHILTDWPKVIEALQNPKTEMTFSDLTSLAHTCLNRLQRAIDAEAYQAIAQRASNRNVRTTHVSLNA